MLAEKITDLMKKGYRIEFKPQDSLFENEARVKVRLSKNYYNVVDIVSMDVMEAGIEDERIFGVVLDELEKRCEEENAR